MEVGVVYGAVAMKCSLCGYRWAATFEAPYINITGEQEVKLPSQLECPQCKHMEDVKYST